MTGVDILCVTLPHQISPLCIYIHIYHPNRHTERGREARSPQQDCGWTSWVKWGWVGDKKGYAWIRGEQYGTLKSTKKNTRLSSNGEK